MVKQRDQEDTGAEPRRGPVVPAAWLWGGLAAEIVVLTVISWWLFPSVWSVSYAMFDLDQSSGPDRGVNLSEVANHPSVMLGETVTISGTVTHRFGERAMILGSKTGFRSDEVLVVTSRLLPSLTAATEIGRLETNRVARVTGVVRRYDALLPGNVVGSDTRGSALVDYSGDAMLVADTIELDPPSEIGPGDKEFFSGSDGYDVGLTTYDIARHGAEYLGDEVAVSGEIEEGLLTPHLFRLGDEQLLVVSPEPRPDLFVEATAYVVGEVRRFDRATLQAKFGIEFGQEQLDEYQGEPVVVARIVEMVT